MEKKQNNDAGKQDFYKVIKVGRISARKTILHKWKTLEEAKRIVESYPDSNRSMVIFTKQ
jgi:hypothetical protein